MTSQDILICIPARYASTRLPAKPLQKIAGVEMIKRVAAISEYVCKSNKACSYVVATDHTAIEKFCNENNINVTMTPETCRNGTERCFAAVQQASKTPQLIINLQGDNPLCPPWILQDLIDSWHKNNSADVYTPYVRLSWDEYTKLLADKKTTPYSGTTVLVNKNDFALAFSKSILPAIRKIEDAKKNNPELSPVRRHIGLYAYTYYALEKYFEFEESEYEKNYIEGLEQMRYLYNGLKIKMVAVDYRGRETTSGVDSPEDINRVEKIIKKYGELV
ncbi:MAG: 3-deoxy-manno-octulosonate cytidylyltransferase [Deltaproteobacteria bacterium]|nr:3-deoxy-manno-octulosonate cytidylyltransferase [Deltaproteobacteria bacterium]